MTLRVFVGSSTEAAASDLLIRSKLEQLGAKPLLWKGICPPGDTILEALLRSAATVDAALLIARGDDLVTIRGVGLLSPRDNVLLEIGLFIAAFGRRRTAIVKVPASDGEDPHLPTDLNGITTLKLTEKTEHTFEHQLSTWLDSVKDEVASQPQSARDAMRLLREDLCKLPSGWREDVDRHVLGPIAAALQAAMNGEIYLTTGQYYQSVYAEMDCADANIAISAVSTMSGQYWIQDREQRQYFLRNLKARKRGAQIRRLFVCQDDTPELLDTFLQHLGAGIAVRRITTSVLAEIPSLHDMVCFMDAPTGSFRTYVTDRSILNLGRLRQARLMLPSGQVPREVTAFEQAWARADVVDQSSFIHLRQGTSVGVEPAVFMKASRLDREVISCEEASKAKSIPLRNELKTLIIKTSSGFVAVHVPGDRQASLRKIKTALESDQASLCTEEELGRLGLMPGTVCAIKNPTWGLTHLIDRSLFSLEYVSTNDGSRKGYYQFKPSILLDANEEMIGEFSDEPTTE